MSTATTQRTVTIIPAKINLPFNVLSASALRRVAGYARVSTNDEEQLTSYEAQVDVFTKRIKANPEWEFAGIYADRDRSGTTTKHRDDFNRMIADALAGKIDLIITKSVSRFARNTVDTLTTVRDLKDKGVEVYFQKENIYTLDSKGELLITIMSSLAQEESRSISENVTWGMRKRFSDGKVSLPYKHFLGYMKGPDGVPAIVEEEAEIVRLIYRLFLYGKSPSFIASLLTDEGVPTPAGKAVWRPNVIISILTNEKMKGDAKLQKCFTVDFLNKKMKINEGEVPQYYVHGSHPAIIEPGLFDLVQFEMKRRQQSDGRTSSAHPFSGKIFCGECGGMYGPARLDNKAEIFEAYDEVLRVLTDNTDLDAEVAELNSEREVVMELTRKAVQENATTALDQGEYRQRFAGLEKRYAAADARLAEIGDARLERSAKRTNITRFLQTLIRQGDDIVTEFGEELWYITVDFITVYADGRLVVTFRDGGAVTIAAEIWKAA